MPYLLTHVLVTVVREIPHVIHLLTETPPSLQQRTVETYFTPTAQFTHPFCRTGSSAYSRYLVARIYRWYKIMSPRMAVHIQSVSFDRENMVLYVGLTQVFAIWAVPTHRSKVSLVTVLHLERLAEPPASASEQPKHQLAIGNGAGDSAAAVPVANGGAQGEKKHVQNKGSEAGGAKYYISSQNDLYQTDQFVKFVLPWISFVVPLWQITATIFCVMLSYLFYPVTWWEETYQHRFRRPEQPPEWNDAR